MPALDPITRPYFNLAPSVDHVTVAVGQPMTIDIDAYSDGVTPDWNTSVKDLSGTNGGTPNAATFSLSAATANNGAKLQLLVTLNKVVPAAKPVLLMLTSERVGLTHRWPIAIASP